AAGERRPRAPDDRPRRGGVAAADRLPLSRCDAQRDHHRPRGLPAGGARSARPHRGALAVSAVAVVGSVAFDDIETPAGLAEHVPGGSAPHLSVAASYFAPVHLIAAVGDACDTMNHWIESARGPLEALLPRIDLLVVKDEEARLLSGERNVARAARRILARGPRSVLIKRGEYGAILFSPESVFAVPAFPLEEV